MKHINKNNNLLGKTFKRLKVIKLVKDKRKGAYWLCKCICGNTTVTSGYHLRQNITRSCGCLQKEFGKKLIQNLKNKKFNRLLVIKYAGLTKHHQSSWECICDCGKKVIVLSQSLLSGHTRSCGCLVKNGRIRKSRYSKEENLKRRKSKEEKIWSHQVKERDNFTCKICDKLGVRLNSHHLLPYAKFKNERFLLKNGITLCEKCHRLFHKNYGYRDFNKDDFIEFKNLIQSQQPT